MFARADRTSAALGKKGRPERFGFPSHATDEGPGEARHSRRSFCADWLWLDDLLAHQAIRRLLLRQAQHHVSDHAGDRDVEPEWKGPAGKLAVLRKAAGERKEQGDQEKRQRDYGQHNVAGEERKIKRTIGGKGGITDVSVERVMKDVAHEKERGEDECCDHGSAVGGNLACADKGKADEQSRGAEAVEQGIERGQKSKTRAGSVCGRMHINQPKEKQRGCRADSQDDSDA